MGFIEKLKSYLNACYPALVIQTHEEGRVCREIYDALKKTCTIYEWDCLEGLTERGDKIKAHSETTDPLKVFSFIQNKCKTDSKENHIFIFKDFHLQMERPLKKADYIRMLRNTMPYLKAKNNMILMVGPTMNIPFELTKDIQLLDYALPGETAINERLNFIHQSVNEGGSKKLMIPEPIRESAVEAAKGLTGSEIESAFALAIVENKSFNEGFVRSVFKEKVQQVKKGGLLTYLDPDISFDNVGGLDGIKKWIKIRRGAYSKQAREFGLPFPKGIGLAGIPGCGKTLLAKATAREFGFPLFQVDLGQLFNKYVGATESNFANMIKTIEGIGRCVLLIDEIEKYLNESAVGGSGDSGTSSRSFGTLLSWLSDRESPVFIIFTSNDHTILPPALKRKGRFDNIFWVDLPSQPEREDIFNVVIRKYKRDPKTYDIKTLAQAADGYAGVEIDEVFKNSLFHCFAANTNPTNKDILSQMEELTPQSKIDAERIEVMRRAAASLTVATSTGEARTIDKPESRRVTV